MLTVAFKEGTAWGINWEQEPLPKYEFAILLVHFVFGMSQDDF